MSEAPQGWYDDPRDPSKELFWDGERWNGERAKQLSTTPAPAPASSPSKQGGTHWFVWVMAAVAAVALLVAIGSSGGDSGDQREHRQSAAAELPPSASPTDRVEAALDHVQGPVEDPEISDVSFGPASLTVTAKTPEGGFEGTSTQDLDWQAQAIFGAVYGEADYAKATVIVFRGGLMNSATGESLPNAKTGSYYLDPELAKRIDWANPDRIDWSLYRTFASPALKQD